MAIEPVKAYFKQFNLEQRIREFTTSSATVELAAQALGVVPARIAKTLSFKKAAECLLVVMAGDAKVNNAKFRSVFDIKAKMLTPDEVLHFLGHAVGGVCPFAIPAQIPVYLDRSLQRFNTIFPACGSSNSAIELSCDELMLHARSRGWVDVATLKRE